MINKPESGKQAHHSPSSLIFRGCPYLGMIGDADTPLMFPLEGAVCHRAQPVSEVELSYQQTMCLTAQHESCEVFLRQQRAPLPPEISGWQAGGRRSRRLFWGTIVILFFATVGVMAGLLWVNGSDDLEALIPAAETKEMPVVTGPAATAATATRAHTATAAPAATHTAAPTPAPTAAPTRTSAPTDVPTPPLPATFTPAPPPDTPTATAVRPRIIVNVDRLNVRQGPGVTYLSLGLAELGAVYEVTGRIANNSWLQICCVADLQGWVLAETVLIEGDIDRVPIITDLLPAPEP